MISLFMIATSITIISGNEIIRRDRGFPGADEKASKGVCFYVRSSVNFVLRSHIFVNELENLCIEIRKPNSKLFLIGTWYRPPNSTVDTFDLFESLIGRLDAENVEYYCIC